MKLSALFASLCLALALAGCAPVTGIEAPTTAQAPSYTLGASDSLRVIFYGEDALSGEYGIDGQGNLSLPLVGEVKAAGLTSDQLQQKLTQIYADGGYLIDPKIAVEITDYRPYFILGEVNAPGQYPYIPGLTIQQAVATAKGFTYRAQQNVVMVTHWGSDKEVAYQLAPGAAVSPGDTIRVEERHF